MIETPKKKIEKPLSMGVVGLGYLGRFHCEKIHKANQAKLSAVCDLNKNLATEYGTRFEVPFFEHYQDLIGKVDAVSIAADTTAHFEIANFFLNQGIHVQVEKPIACHSGEARKLVELANRQGLKFQVGHVERFNPALLAAQEKLKKPLFIECHRLAPFKPRSLKVDVVLDLMIHDLDVIMSLVRSPVRSVAAVGTPVVTSHIDIANARLEFESGTIANVTASRVSPNSVRKFRVFQPDQYLSIDFGNGEVRLTTKMGKIEDPNTLPLHHETWNLEKGDALALEMQAFIDSINQDLPCVVPGEDGLAALKLAEEILKKIRERSC